MRLAVSWIAAFLLVATLVPACSGPTGPDPIFADFVLDVEGERFTIRVTDPETIRLAEENRQGGNRMFPIGTLRGGSGGFNQPWTWHLEPTSVRFVEAAIEVCDGRPSYVEAHQPEFPTYCPWGAQVVARR